MREDANDTVERIFKNSWAQCPGITTADPLVLPGPGKPSDEEILQLEIALAVSGVQRMKESCLHVALFACSSAGV